MFKFKAPTKKKKRKLISTSKLREGGSDENSRSSSDDDEDGHFSKNKSHKKYSNADYDDDGIIVEDEDMEEKEEDAIFAKRSKKKKKSRKKSGAIKNTLSFAHKDMHNDDLDEEHEESIRITKTDKDSSKRSSKKKKDKKKKKKMKSSHPTKGGLGFGGANVLSHLEDEDNEGEEAHAYDDGEKAKGTNTPLKRSRFAMGKLQDSIIYDDDDDDYGDNGNDTFGGKNEENDTNNASTSLYGKEALEKLKASQKTTHAMIIEESSVTEKKSLNDNPHTDHIPSMQQQATTKSCNSNTTESNNSNDKNVPLPPKPISTPVPKPPSMDNDFIPLDSTEYNSTNHNVASHLNIVSGDDALMYAEGNDDDDEKHSINRANLGTETLSNIPMDKHKSIAPSNVFMGNMDDVEKNVKKDQDVEIDEGGRKWEEEIARRAGVTSAPTLPTQKDQQRNTHSRNTFGANTENSSSEEDRSSHVLKDVKRALQSTLESLTQMDLDLESNVGRRGHDEEISSQEAAKKEKELDDIGKKFEYYQNLRVKLADWVGALRHVSERVTMVENAINNLNNEFATKDEKVWREWEDDVVLALKDRGLLDYVVGRQPKNEVKPEDNCVDEFGRDRSSLESMARTKRASRRRRIRAESNDRRRAKFEAASLRNSAQEEKIEVLEYEDTDLDLSDNELMDREERRNAVSDAIGVVMEDMAEEYSTPSTLLSAFESWQSQYPEDFDQCYAKATFVELMNVFVRSESCQKLDFLCLANMNGNMNFDDFSWFIALKRFHGPFNDKRMAKLAATAISNLVSKLSGTFLSIFKNPENTHGLYNPFSTKQTKLLISFFGEIKKHIGDDKELIKTISGAIFQHINASIQNSAIPITKQIQDGTEFDDILTFSLFGQLQRLRKLLFNLLKWYDVLEGEVQVDIAKFCLMDLIAYRFLPILNSLDVVQAEKKDFDSKTALKQVSDLIESKGLFKENNMALSSAPLRAALSKLD